ncbi:MAG: PDR/VanB family oxidoreductase [Aeromicrobium sp.]
MTSAIPVPADHRSVPDARPTTGAASHARVTRIVRECDDVVSIQLEPVGDDPLPSWTPGSHVDLFLPQAAVRQYSLCGRPDDRSWRLAVRRDPGGRGGSRYLHETLIEGMTLQIGTPRNHFALVPATSYALLAGGIGVTPLLPIAAALRERGATWRLDYVGRTAASMPFRDELGRHGDAVNFYASDHGERLDLAVWVAGLAPSTAIYACGPPALLEALAEQVGTRTDLALHTERFRPAATDPGDAAADTAFELVLSESGVVTSVGSGETILEAVEREGVFVPTACLEGTCGSCVTDVIDGVVEHRDSVLTADEQTNQLCVCVSRCTSGRLTLRL